MKLCIPVNAPKGLESLLQSHLPSAEHLLFSTPKPACVRT